MQFNNSASRVLRVIERVRAHGDPNESAPLKFRDIWYSEFRVRDDSKLFTRLSELRQEVDAIEKFAIDTEMHNSRWMNKFDAIRGEFLPTHADETRRYVLLDPMIPFVLDHFSHVMPNGKSIDQSDLDALLDQINNLFNEVRKMDLPKALKSWVLELLIMIQQAIEKTFIYGARGLKRELFKIAGAFSEHYQELAEVQPEVATSIQTMISHSVNVASVASSALAIADPVLKLLNLAVGGGPV